MVDPVIAEDGITYEREAILNWLKINRLSPITRKPISKKLQFNSVLKRRIECMKD